MLDCQHSWYHRRRYCVEKDISYCEGKSDIGESDSKYEAILGILQQFCTYMLLFMHMQEESMTKV